MGLLSLLTLGKGTLRPRVRATLEEEGLVLIEEGLNGTVRYDNFKAPGRRHRGKVTGERMGLGISEQRFVLYCRSGHGKLINTLFSNPRAAMLEVSLEGDDTVALKIDYDRMDEPKVSGQITLRAKTPNAPRVVEELRRRLPG